eukprot:CCRYP_001227-RA/>CCRYP_001227-RA protein AED:0.00 eAED:0.00 QI:64/1/1/1/0/0/2/36/60
MNHLGLHQGRSARNLCTVPYSFCRRESQQFEVMDVGGHSCRIESKGDTLIELEGSLPRAV